MNRYRNATPADGDGGQSPETGNNECTSDTIPRFSGTVNPLPFNAMFPPYPLPVSAGKLAWTIQDTIATLLAELQARGLDIPDSEVDQAIANTWVLMASADYVGGRLRTWGNEQWRQNWERHFTVLREQGDGEVAHG